MNLFSQVIMSRFGQRQRFGKNIHKHIFRLTIDQLNCVILGVGVITNEMVPYVNALFSPLGHAVVRNRDARLIVFVNVCDFDSHGG